MSMQLSQVTDFITRNINIKQDICRLPERFAPFSLRRGVSISCSMLTAVILLASCRKEEAVKPYTDADASQESVSTSAEPDTPKPDPSVIDVPLKEKKLTFVVDRTLPVSIYQPVVSSDGKYVVKGSSVYRLSDGEMVLRPPKSGPPAVFSPDSRFLVCYHEKSIRDSYGNFYAFELETGQQTATFSIINKMDKVEKLAFSPDGTHIYVNTFGVPAGIEKFDFSTHKNMWRVADSRQYGFSQSRVFHTDPEGKWLFAKSSRKPIGVYSTENGKLVHTIGSPKTICSLTQGRWLTTQDDQIEIYDTVSLQKVNTRSFDARISENGMADLYFRWSYWQNKNYLIGHCISGVVFIDINSSELVAEYKRFPGNTMSDVIPKEEWITDVVILPDNETLMICSRSDTVLGRLVFE